MTDEGAPEQPKPKRRIRRTKRLSTRLSAEKRSQLLTDVAMHAPGETRADICKRYGISERTLFRIQKKAAPGSQLAADVAAKKSVLAEGWKDSRIRFLRNSIDKLEKLVAAATVEQIREVAGAIKIVGDLQNVSSALGDPGEQQLGSDRAGETPAADATGSGGARAAPDPPSVH